MKKIIEKIIRQRNSRFSFDEALTTRMLFSFAIDYLTDAVRGFKRIFFGLKPQLVFFGRNINLFNASQIYFGRYVKVGSYTTLSALGKEGIFIGNNSGIGAFSRIIVSTSLNDIGNFIRIGNNVGIGEYAYLGGAGGLTIGDDCIIGQYLSCHPENHNYENTLELIRHQGISRKGIVIGRNCWIGSKVTILDGVIIGNNCVIAAGAVVTQSMPPHSVIGGVPARVIKSTINNKEIQNIQVA